MALIWGSSLFRAVEGQGEGDVEMELEGEGEKDEGKGEVFNSPRLCSIACMTL